MVVVVPESDVPLMRDRISVTASDAKASASIAPVAMAAALIAPAANVAASMAPSAMAAASIAPAANVAASMAPAAIFAAVIASLAIAVLSTAFATRSTVVPVRACAVVGLPMLAQSRPASPPADTSMVRPSVVGRKARVTSALTAISVSNTS